MNKPLSSYNLFAREKRLEGLPFVKIGELWRGPEGEKWREAHLGDGEMNSSVEWGTSISK